MDPSLPVPLRGVWSAPIPDFRICTLAATPDLLLVAGWTDTRAEVRPARWDGQRLAFEETVVIPPPPWGSGEVHEPWPSLYGESMAVARIAGDQCGSAGIAFFDTLYGEPTNIESPTDSDIDFGQPLALGRDELFTIEDDRILWRYARQADGRFLGEQLSLPSEITALGSWGMALSPDRTRLAVISRVNSLFRLEIFWRAGATMRHRQSIPLPGETTGLAFAARRLLLSFLYPSPDGTGLWAFIEQNEVFVPSLRLRLPDRGGACSHALAVSDDWAVLVHPVALFLVDLHEGAVRATLALPEPSTPGRPRVPAVALLSYPIPRVVAALEGRIGVYEISR